MIPGGGPGRSAPAGPVTLAVVNARVWTGDARRPWADAVVVRGERIAFVGSGAEARKLARAAPAARVIDAAGQFLASAVADFRPLRPGEPADFVVVDRDLTRVAPDAAGDARVVLAVAGGRVADERPSATP